MALTHKDLYELLAEVLVGGHYVDGSRDKPHAIHGPDGFRDEAERLRQALEDKGVDVDGGEIPVLRSDGKYVDLR